MNINGELPNAKKQHEILDIFLFRFLNVFKVKYRIIKYGVYMNVAKHPNRNNG